MMGAKQSCYVADTTFLSKIFKDYYALKIERIEKMSCFNSLMKPKSAESETQILSPRHDVGPSLKLY